MGKFTKRLARKGRTLFLLRDPADEDRVVVLRRSVKKEVGAGALWMPVFREEDTAQRIAEVQGEAMGRDLKVSKMPSSEVRRFALKALPSVDLIYVEGGPSFACTPLGGKASMAMLREQAEASGSDGEKALMSSMAAIQWPGEETLRPKAMRQLRNWVP